MKKKLFRLLQSLLILSIGLVLPNSTIGQIEESITVSQNNATISTDRNGGRSQQAYRHNIPAPGNPCGTDLEDIIVTIRITDISIGNAACNGIGIFANLYFSSVCNIGTNNCGAQAQLLTPGCTNFDGEPDEGTYTFNIRNCNNLTELRI